MSCNCNDEPIINNIIGEKGADGNNGWTPIVSSPTVLGKKVLEVTGWFGGTGTPPASNVYIYPGGYTSDATLATDFTGPQGATGSTGSSGNNGWTMVPAVVVDPNDSSRYVIQIVDYTGGSGSKPSITNQFIGAAGIVNTASAAVNVIGPQGPQGNPGTTLPSPTGQNGKFLGVSGNAYTILDLPSDLPVISSNTRRVLREKADGTGVEWYSSFSQYVRIQMTSVAIFASNNSYVTLRNSGSTTFLKVTLPNDGKTRNLFISSSLMFQSNSPDGSNAFAWYAIRDITNNTTIIEDQIYTYQRQNPALEYFGSFVCSGQDIGIQFKNDVGQNTTIFFGGSLSVFEKV